MRRYAVVAGLVLATALVSPARADHERYITLTGNRTGYVDLTFTRDVAFFTQLSTFRGSASVAGFQVRRLDKNMSAITALWVRGYSPSAQGTQAVEPGRYRIYLLANGPATVRIHTEGGVRSHLTPRLHPAPFVSNVGDIPVTKEPTQRWYGERTTRVPFDVSMVITAYQMALPDDQVSSTWGSVSSCTTAGDVACPGADTQGYLPPSTTPPRKSHGWSYSNTYKRGDVIHYYYAGTVRPDAAGSAVLVIGQ